MSLTAHRISVPTVAVAAGLLLTACGSGAPSSTAGQPASHGTPGGGDATTEHSQDAPAPDPGVGGAGKEVGALAPRLLMSHANGLILLDAASGIPLADKEYEAFLRLNNAGDGRHVMVSDGDTFRVYDTGIQAQAHGDHAHNFEYKPGLTDITFDMPEAGHVVLHNGRTALFSDGTGEILAYDSAALTESERNEKEYATDEVHHGVAFELTDGSLITTQGNDDERKTVQVTKGKEMIAETTDCPGVHGEAVAEPTAAGDVVAFGCENGPVIFRDGSFHKVAVNDAYSRSGNLFGHEKSPIVLGDYKVDKDAEPVERPTRIALINTRTDSLQLVDLGSAYWFRSFARGPEGEGLVLTYDGSLHKIDVDTGQVTDSVQVIEPWEEKAEWQEPGPAVKVAGDKAYVSDAERQKMHVVNVASLKEESSYALPAAPVEFTVTTGKAEAPARDSATGEHGH